MNDKYLAIEHTTEVAVFTINNKELPPYLLTAWLCKISNQTLPSKILLIYDENDEMPYLGQLNTIQKEMPQLLLLDSSTSSPLLPESFLLFPAFALFFSPIAVNHQKNIEYAHCPLKAFPSFFSRAIYFLCLRLQCILSSQHTLETSLSMEKPQTISKNFL